MGEGNSDGIAGWEFGKVLHVVEAEGIKRALVNGQPYMSWEAWDATAERIAIVQLNELGIVTQEELAKGFGVHVNSVTNYVAAFKANGSNGLKSEPRGPKQSWKLVPEMRGKILWIVFEDGIRGCSGIQKRLKERWEEKVSIESIRQVLLENGLAEENIGTQPKQWNLFW
mgnify:FL=1